MLSFKWVTDSGTGSTAILDYRDTKWLSVAGLPVNVEFRSSIRDHGGNCIFFVARKIGPHESKYNLTTHLRKNIANAINWHRPLWAFQTWHFFGFNHHPQTIVPLHCLSCHYQASFSVCLHLCWDCANLAQGVPTRSSSYTLSCVHSAIGLAFNLQQPRGTQTQPNLSHARTSAKHPTFTPPTGSFPFFPFI